MSVTGYWTDSGVRSTSLSGSGTKTDPYLLTSGADLGYLAYTVSNGTTYASKYFQITQSIDLSAHYWEPIGSTSTSTKSFAAAIDGQWNTISGIDIDFSKGYEYAGFIGYYNPGSSRSTDCTISNMIFETPYISGGYDGEIYVGTVAARSDYGQISNILVKEPTLGTSTGNGNASSYVGGICGWCSYSSISNCDVVGLSSSSRISSQDSTTYNHYVGGMGYYRLSWPQVDDL